MGYTFGVSWGVLMRGLCERGACMKLVNAIITVAEKAQSMQAGEASAALRRSTASRKS